QKLTKNIERDIFLGTTTVGIHKDDIFMTIGGVDVRSFASQGQQRSVALALKLSEIELMKEITGKTPVLLLDDVFSELDEHRQRFLINFLNDIQTIITCTGIEDIMAKNWLNTDDVRIFKVESGLICPKESS
ncbi:MAG: DNA replication and repair protein RecF, partial [Defluviitaleaceae bacterium]|nr:DNA replication and repair protein RecF [Defluviitaleaceae bacterium]